MKILFLLTLCLLRPIWAADNVNLEGNAFWSVVLPQEPVSVGIAAQDARLAEDCRRYETEVRQVKSDDELKWARGLPLAGDMKDHYEGVFRLSVFPELPLAGAEKISGQTLNPYLRADLMDVSTKAEVKPSSAAWLTQMSADFRLPPSSLHLQNGAPDRILRVSGRDLACDLLAGRTQIYLKTRGQILLSAGDVLKLNRFYDPIEEKTQTVLRDPEKLPAEQAADLGLFYGEMCERIMANSAATDCVGRLFSFLFEPESLQYSPVWTFLGDEPVLAVPKSVSVPEMTIVAVATAAQSAEPLIEGEENRIEKALERLKEISYEQMTARQREEHRELVQKRAVYIKQKIFARYGRYL